MEIAFDDGMCSECEEAGCTGEGECDAPGAYGGDAETMPPSDVDALLTTDFTLDMT